MVGLAGSALRMDGLGDDALHHRSRWPDVKVARRSGRNWDDSSISIVWLYYGALLAIVWMLGRIDRLRSIVDDPLRSLGRMGSASRVKSVPLWLLLAGGASAAIIWAAALDRPDGVLRVAFVDVGQGDAIFITTPRGNQILVDGGPTPSKITRYLGENMPFLDRTIEIVRYSLQTPFRSCSMF